MRPSKNDYYINIAEVVATRSTCLRHKYGAVIVNNDIIIATGYNGAPRGEVSCYDTGKCYKETHLTPEGPSGVHGEQYGSCVAVHAEQNALLSASRADMRDGVLYLACLDDDRDAIPCNYCSRMIKNAGICQVITKEGLL